MPLEQDYTFIKLHNNNGRW